MLPDLSVTPVTRSRLADVDFDNLGFGNVFSDHMFSMTYEQGRWQQPEVSPYGPVPVDPGNATLHYGRPSSRVSRPSWVMTARCASSGRT